MKHSLEKIMLPSHHRQEVNFIILHKIFDETLIVPRPSDKESVRKLVNDSVKTTGLPVANANAMADLVSERYGNLGCKTVLRLLDRSVAAAASTTEQDQAEALQTILDDLAGDNALVDAACRVF